MNTGDLLKAGGSTNAAAVIHPDLAWQPWEDEEDEERDRAREQWKLFLEEVPLERKTLKFLFANGFKTKSSILGLQDVSIFESIPSYMDIQLGYRNQLSDYINGNNTDRMKSITRANAYKVDDSRLNNVPLEQIIHQARQHFAKMTSPHSESALSGMIERDDSGKGDYYVRGQRTPQGKTRIYFHCMLCAKSISVKPLAKKSNDVGFTVSNVLTHCRNSKHIEARQRAHLF